MKLIENTLFGGLIRSLENVREEIIYRITEWAANRECPIAWEEHSYDDYDAGCSLGDRSPDCGYHIYCYFPKWALRLIRRYLDWREERWFKLHEHEL